MEKIKSRAQTAIEAEKKSEEKPVSLSSTAMMRPNDVSNDCVLQSPSVGIWLQRKLQKNDNNLLNKNQE